MPQWPASLPQSLNADDYAEAEKSGVLRTQMDAGPDFTRRRFSAVPTNIADTIYLSRAQYDALKAFYTTTLNGGADAFDWVHPVTGADVSMRFLSPVSYRAFSDDLFGASLSLEILP